MHGRVRRLAIAALLALGALLVGALHDAHSTSLRVADGYCNVSNPTHFLYGRTGSGGGEITCDTTRYFDYTARLYNHAGDVLAETISDDTQQDIYEFSPLNGCAGAYVRGYIFVNYEGDAQSTQEDFSQETFC